MILKCPITITLSLAQLLSCVISIGLFVGCQEPVPTDPLVLAQEAVENGNYRLAKSHARKIGNDDPRWPEAQLILGGLEAMNRSPIAALPYFESIPQDGSPVALKAIRAIAEIQQKRGAFQPAVQHFREVLQSHPHDRTILKSLAVLLADSGQRFEAENYLLQIAQTGFAEVQDVVLLTEPDRPQLRLLYLQQCAQANRRDPFVLLGLACELIQAKKLDEAREHLKITIEIEPELAEAQALLGEMALDQGLESIAAWNAQLPNSARVQTHPDIYYVRGLWARQMKADRVAARCFWETVRQRPHHRRAMFQLGQTLAPLDMKLSTAFAQRTDQLNEYSHLMEQTLIQRGKNEELMKQIVALLRAMGRDVEAYAWLTLARDQFGPTGWPAPLIEELKPIVEQNPPRFQPDRDVARINDLSSYPEFQSLSLDDLMSDDSVHPRQEKSSTIRFLDQARELGIETSFFQSPDDRTHEVRIFESTGGGIGILDFDLDGLPDLLLTQGEHWPRGQEVPAPSSDHRDSLYRNQGDRFEECAEQAGLGVEDGYGQGCSVGDFNNDGFPDLYIANIGVNQLLLNQGDGTYIDVTHSAGLQGDDWTTSCLIMDLNDDGNPDLFDVNYLQGDKIFSTECSASHCSVRNYDGAPDRVQLSNGDGTFYPVANATPITTPKGLGVVAFYVGQERKPSLFIANDQVPNFFLRPIDDEGHYRDDAMISGLAVNMDGQPTACMGVASGDLNHDNLIDLFVTNFEGEANNLYLQRHEGFFEDAITGTGLRDPGIPYVGWGTQFLDADSDGELDVVVSNGHIAHFGLKNVEYDMPTQFYRNSGGGRFELLSPDSAGQLFARKALGRSLALIDWNRDQRLDFVLSPIASPVVLATNSTDRPGHSVGVRLHARHTSRDAHGAIVEVLSGSTTWQQQLIAGSGYQVSNERQLQFGLGQSDVPVTVTVHWPSGSQTTIKSVPVDTVIELSEGISVATAWNGSSPSSLKVTATSSPGTVPHPL